MRFNLFALLFLLSFSTTAQPKAVTQIKAIFDDASTGFQQFRGAKRSGSDTSSATFNTASLIEGTMDNSIFRDGSISMYSATISDWVSRNRAKEIAKKWIADLSVYFKPFREGKRTNYYGSTTIDYVFRKDNTSISIDIVPGKDSSPCIVIIHISYVHIVTTVN